MPAEPHDVAYLWDMLDAALAIVEYVSAKKLDDDIRDRMLRDAVERNFEILGQAARRVSESFRAGHPEIPWRRIIGLRNILAHDYGEIKNEKMWDLAKRNIPELANAVRPLVPPIE